MAAGTIAPTVPFCGACGFDQNESLNADVFCDACGADLNAFGFGGLFPPADVEAVGGSLTVTFTWTLQLDTSDLLYQIDGGAPVLITGANPAGEVVAATAGQKVAGSVRYVVGGIDGPFSAPVAAVATA